MNEALATSIGKFLLRRGLTVLGAAGAQVSDEWVGQTVSLALIVINELIQWIQSHKAEKIKVVLKENGVKP